MALGFMQVFRFGKVTDNVYIEEKYCQTQSITSGKEMYSPPPPTYPPTHSPVPSNKTTGLCITYSAAN